MTKQEKRILIEVPERATDFKIEAEYRPYCVWLFGKGIVFPIPIGNRIHPYRHDEVGIVGTTTDGKGTWLILEAKTKEVTHD